MRLKDQSAIVTGAASGFGAAIAERFAAEGARVVVADLNEAQGEAVARRIGGLFARCDVSRANDVQALVQTAVQAHGRLDIVVNNAGVTHVNKPHLEVTEDEFDRLYRVNVKSLFHMNRAAVPAMRANPGGSSGVFVNVASTTGVRPGPGLCWYSGSKGAVITTSKGLALEPGAREHPCVRGQPHDRRDGDAGAVHGHARHPGEPPALPGPHPAGPLHQAGGRGGCCGVPRQ